MPRVHVLARRLVRWLFPPVERSTDPRNRVPFDPNVQYKGQREGARYSQSNWGDGSVEQVARKLCQTQRDGVTVAELAAASHTSEVNVARTMRYAVKARRFMRVVGKRDGITRWRPVP